MKNIRFISDTSTTLTTEFMREHNITMVCNAVSNGNGEVFVDERTNAQKAKICDEIENKNIKYTTSFVNTGILQEVVGKLLKECDVVVYLSLGKGYSGQYNAAMEAAKSFPNKFIVIHSNAIACNSEILIKWAFEYLKTHDLNVKEMENIINEMNENITTIFSTSKYQGLVNTGRAPAIVTKALKMFKLFPLIVSEEANKKFGFFKTWENVDQKVLEAIDKRFSVKPRGDEIIEMYLCSSILTKDRVKVLIEKMTKHFKIAADKIHIRITPLVVMAATLTDSYGICIYTKSLTKIPVK